jgi:hypothetical protein
MDYGYTVKVYCDAIEMGFRSVESVPCEYQESVKQELSKRSWKKCSGMLKLKKHEEGSV